MQPRNWENAGGCPKVWAYPPIPLQLPRGERGRHAGLVGTRDRQAPNLEGERADWEPFWKKREVLTWSLLPGPGHRMGFSAREGNPKGAFRADRSVHGQLHLNPFASCIPNAAPNWLLSISMHSAPF